MERQSVVSSNVWSIGYDAASDTLEVEYKSGGVYQYFGVPNAEYYALMQAESKGRYLNDHIKNRYDARQVK